MYSEYIRAEHTDTHTGTHAPEKLSIYLTVNNAHRKNFTQKLCSLKLIYINYGGGGAAGNSLALMLLLLLCCCLA